MALLFAALAVVGALAPLGVLAPWLGYNGFDWSLFAGQALAGRPARAVAVTLALATAVGLVQIVVQGRRDRVPLLWLPFLATLLFGLGCGLPLFLSIREATLGRRARALASKREETPLDESAAA